MELPLVFGRREKEGACDGGSNGLLGFIIIDEWWLVQIKG
jgi:hypothetical protein